MALLAVVSCQKPEDERPDNPDNPPVVIDPVKLEGSGNLEYIDVDTKNKITTKSTYKWSATDENGIVIEVNIDTKQYVEGDGTEDGVPGGAWEIGTFMLPLADIGEFLGVSPSETLNPDNFYPVCSYLEGASGWTSYMPGMWLNNDSVGCGWGDGNAFWQWYIWGGKTFTIGDSETTVGYDISDDGNYDNYKGLLFLGGNPGNTKKSGGKTIKSHNIINIGKEINFDITFKFGPYEAPVDQSEAINTPTGTTVLLEDPDTPTEYPLSWDLSSAAMNFTCELPLSISGEYWRVGYVKFDLDMFSEIVGKDFASLTKDDFYPTDKDGNRLTKKYTGADLEESDTEGWTSWGDCPGEWVLEDGRLSNWSAGAAYWWWNFAEHPHEIDIEGAFVIGNGPSAEHYAGQAVTSYNMCCGIPFVVTVKYVE